MSELGAPYSDAEQTINRIFDRLDTEIRRIIMGAADDAVKAATEQLRKAAAEIDTEVSESAVSPEAIAGLKEVVQQLDDRNPDTPAEGETPPEPA